MRSFFTFFLIIFCLILAIFLFDVSYLFHGIRCTYFRGESSAQIDDHRFFYTREVVSNTPVLIPNGHDYVGEVSNNNLRLVLEKSNSVAFLLVQNDSVRVEKYWQGYGPESLTNSFSMAKSIMSILVGCAIDDGYLEGVDESVFDFVPELEPFKKNDVKIKHLLEMSSGYDWLENYKRPISVTAKAYYGTALQDLILQQRFVDVPGKEHVYSSGSTQLLGLVLERAVGENISSYAGEALWSRVGAKQNALWTLDSEGGLEKTFCCFNSSARDFSKIGLLMLNGGRVGFNRVVSKNYVDWLLSVPELIDSKNTQKGERFVDYYSNGWWVARVLEKEVFYARGFLGQYIVVVPDLNLVFVRLGMSENEKSELKNDYMLTDNLKFFIEQVILDFS